MDDPSPFAGLPSYPRWPDDDWPLTDPPSWTAEAAGVLRRMLPAAGIVVGLLLAEGGCGGLMLLLGFAAAMACSGVAILLGKTTWRR